MTYMCTLSKFDRINLLLYHFAITEFVIKVKTRFKQKFRSKYAKK